MARGGDPDEGWALSEGISLVGGFEAARSPELSVSALFSQHFEDVYRMVARLLGPGASDADIEDITQLVFIAAHRGRHRYRGEGRVTTWLYGIATKVVLSQLRSWRRQRRLVAALELELNDPTPSPERQAEAKHELARVWRCLMRLSPKLRVVYVLAVVEGRTGEEIASMLDIPVATVWSRQHQAKKKLAAALERDQRRRAS